MWPCVLVFYPGYFETSASNPGADLIFVGSPDTWSQLGAGSRPYVGGTLPEWDAALGCGADATMLRFTASWRIAQ